MANGSVGLYAYSHDVLCASWVQTLLMDQAENPSAGALFLH